MIFFSFTGSKGAGGTGGEGRAKIYMMGVLSNESRYMGRIFMREGRYLINVVTRNRSVRGSWAVD